MNKTVYRTGIVLAVFAVLVGIVTTPALAHVDVYFSPDPSTLDLAVGENVSVQLLADVDANETYGIASFQVGIDFNPNVVNITNGTNPCKVWIGPPYNVCFEYWWSKDFYSFNQYNGGYGPYGTFVWVTDFHEDGYDAPITVPLANLTIERVGTGEIYLEISPREFTHEIRISPSCGLSQILDKNNDVIPDARMSWHDTFERKLYAGWNLISLPFEPEDNSTSSVLASVWDNVSGSVYKYNAATKQFESVTTMDPGVGYFVYLTSDDYWVYNGTEKYDAMNIWLEPGLNMIGALCWPKNVSDVLTSGDHWYATTFNASEQKYTDTFNPVAPDVFNRLTKMEPGAGYFISAKHGCWLNVSC